MARTLWLVVLGAVIAAVAVVGRSQRDANTAARPAVPAQSRAELQEPASNIGPAAATVNATARLSLLQPQPQLTAAASEASDSPLQRFLDVRGISLHSGAQKDFNEFVAEPRDPAWASGMEAQFQSELSKATWTLTESYVECRRSRCLVLLVEPAGALTSKDPGTAFTRADFDEQVAVASSLNLFGVGTFAVGARDGSLVRWQRFFRRCGPDWQCLPQPHE